VFLLALDFHELTRFSAPESGICLAIELRQISRVSFAAEQMIWAMIWQYRERLLNFNPVLRASLLEAKVIQSHLAEAPGRGRRQIDYDAPQ